MRIIAGKYKGKKLNNNDNLDVRPTMDRSKEGLFNVINFDLFDIDFLDMFAGTGNIGIEAVSRGAKSVTFVESNNKAVKLINSNTENIHEDFIIKCMDCLQFSKINEDMYDIVFLDPPYDIDIDYIDEIINNIVVNIKENGQLIIELPYEYDRVVPIPKSKVKKYGKTYFTIYKKESDE